MSETTGQDKQIQMQQHTQQQQMQQRQGQRQRQREEKERDRALEHVLTSAEALLAAKVFLEHKLNRCMKSKHKRKLAKPLAESPFSIIDAHSDPRVLHSCKPMKWVTLPLLQQPPLRLSWSADETKAAEKYPFSTAAQQAETRRELRLKTAEGSKDGVFAPNQSWLLPAHETNPVRTAGLCNTFPIRAVLFDRDGTLTDADSFEASLRPEVPMLLRWLKRLGIKLAMVTNTHAIALERLGNPTSLAPLMLEDVFDMVFTFEHFPAKPHSQSVLRCSSVWNIPVEHIVMVGDWIDDLEAARCAGMRSLWIYNALQRFKNTGANHTSVVDEHVKDAVRVRYLPTWEADSLSELVRVVQCCNRLNVDNAPLATDMNEVSLLKRLRDKDNGQEIATLMSVLRSEAFQCMDGELQFATWSPCMMRTHPSWSFRLSPSSFSSTSTSISTNKHVKLVIFMEHTLAHCCPLRHALSDGQPFDAAMCRPYMDVCTRKENEKHKHEHQQHKENEKRTPTTYHERRWRQTRTNFQVNVHVNSEMNVVLQKIRAQRHVHVTGIPPIITHEYHATEAAVATFYAPFTGLPSLANLNSLWCMKAFVERSPAQPIPFDVLFRSGQSIDPPMAAQWVEAHCRSSCSSPAATATTTAETKETKEMQTKQQDRVVVLIATEHSFESFLSILTSLPDTTASCLAILRTPWQDKHFIEKITQHRWRTYARPIDTCIVLSSLKELLHLLH